MVCRPIFANSYNNDGMSGNSRSIFGAPCCVSQVPPPNNTVNCDQLNTLVKDVSNISLFISKVERFMCKDVEDPNSTICDIEFLVPAMECLEHVKTNYCDNMANQNYEHIPADLFKYVELYNFIEELHCKTPNHRLGSLLKMIQSILACSQNICSIYGDNLYLRLEVERLEKEIRDILSGKNDKTVVKAVGQFGLTQTFILKPLLSYYIIFYGLPPFGVGFCPIKLGFLKDLLTRHCVCLD